MALETRGKTAVCQVGPEIHKAKVTGIEHIQRLAPFQEGYKQ